MEVIERFAALMECDTVQTWHDKMIQLFGNYDFERFLIAVVPHRHLSLEDAFLLSNYPVRWRETYDSRKLAYVDPTVTHCLQQSTPLLWEPDIFAGKQQRAMYEEAAGHGLRSGLSLPWHGPNGGIGILCFSNDTEPGVRFLNHSVRAFPTLALMRDFAFESLLRLTNPPPEAGKLPRLTHREMECLKWCALGKSSWDISQILRCSEAVVNFHFNNLRRKFDTTSRRQAVVKAIRFGLIHP